ncbi:MAG: AsmA-like C-terminal domain-containing protein, partial [Pseudomonadota bacterium]
LDRLGLQAVIVQDVDIALVKKAGETGQPRHEIGLRSATLVRDDPEQTDDLRQNIVIHTEQNGGRGLSLRVSHVKEKATGKRAFLFDVENVVAANFIERLNRPDYPIKVDVPFSLNGRILTSGTNDLEQAELQVVAGSGVFTTGPKSDIAVTSGELNLILNRRSQSILVSPSPFVFTDSNLSVEGEIKLPERLSDPYSFSLFASDSTISMSDVDGAPVVVDRISAVGAFQPMHKLISVSDYKLKAGEVLLTASAAFGFDGKTPSMAMAADVNETPVLVLKQLWPVFIAPSARKWTINNVQKGTVSNASFNASVQTGVLGNLRKGANLAPDEMQLDFEMRDASFRSFGEFPSIDNATVEGKTRGIAFTADVTDADVLSDYGDVLALKSGRFHIADTRFPGPKAEVDFEVEGDADDLGSVANREPVRALDRAELKPEGLEGKVAASVAVSFPLRADISHSDVDWQAALDVKDFSSPRPLEGRIVENADATITLDAERMTITGKGEIDGIPADIDLSQALDGSQSRPSMAVKVELSDKDRKKLGIDFGQYLTGPLAVTIDQSGEDGEDGQLYNVDLGRATIALDFLGWRKASGVPATASLRIINDEKGVRVRDFKLKGDGFGGEGRVDLALDGTIRALALSKLSLRPGDNISVSAKLRSENIYEVDITGRRFDARSLIKTASEPTGVKDASKYRYKIKAKVGEVTGFQKEVVSDLATSVALRGATVLKLDLVGNIGNANKPFSIRYGSAGSKGDVLSARGSDGGALLRFANLYFRAFGGVFAVNGARAPGSKTLVGKLAMNGFTLVEEPALKGITTTQNAAGQSAVPFNVLAIDFTERDSVVEVTKGLLSGDEVGGTYKGILNRRTKQVQFTGTYVPAYVINNFFTKIPIVGLALGNGQREGLIGVTFKVEGSIAKPKVTVNPLSALAPGFLRQLFKFRQTN